MPGFPQGLRAWDRDRGRPHGPTPPTPPDIRVTYKTAVRLLEASGSGPGEAVWVRHRASSVLARCRVSVACSVLSRSVPLLPSLGLHPAAPPSRPGLYPGFPPLVAHEKNVLLTSRIYPFEGGTVRASSRAAETRPLAVSRLSFTVLCPLLTAEPQWASLAVGSVPPGGHGSALRG